MMRTRAPLRQYLQRSYDERVVQRVWRGIEDKRAKTRGRTSRVGVWVTGFALAAAVLLVVFVRTSKPNEPGSLRRVDGLEPTVLSTAESVSRVAVALDDGSRVSLAPGSRATVVENNGHAFVVVLAAGSADFEVHPGGPRRWSIECGLATVEVVGTHFAIDRDENSVRISVQHGTVLVRGERVPDRVQRLIGGESLVLHSADERPSSVVANSLPAAVPIEPSEPIAVVPTAPTAHLDSPENGSIHGQSNANLHWVELARRGRYQQAYGALGSRGIARTVESATPQELLALADVARLSGHPADAILPLHRLVASHPHDPNTPIAWFTLGRIQLDSMGNAHAAADAFTQAIALGVPRSLSDDASARLVEARSRAGDASGARAAMNNYMARFPNGRHTADVQRWATPR